MKWINAVVSSFKISLYRFLDLSVCTRSRVVVETQDLLLEGGVRAHTGGLKMVGAPHEAFPGVWVGASRKGES